MRCLSIRQPWTWAILNAEKRIENRSRADGRMPSLCSYRGPLLIHASAGCTKREHGEASAWMVAKGLATWELLHASLPYVPHLTLTPRGGIVGVCNVVAFIGPDGFLQGFESPSGWDKAKNVDKRWHIAGSYGLVLADVRPLPFTPFKGALGLFNVPDDIALPLLGGGQ